MEGIVWWVQDQAQFRYQFHPDNGVCYTVLSRCELIIYKILRIIT